MAKRINAHDLAPGLFQIFATDLWASVRSCVVEALPMKMRPHGSTCLRTWMLESETSLKSELENYQENQTHIQMS